jgi:protein-disulfide isomerase
VIPDLIEQFVDTGEVRYVYRELTYGNPSAQKASEAALCAGELGSYWEMNEQLFATTSEWGQAEDPTDFLKGYAKDLGLDSKVFAECLDSGQTAVILQGEQMAAQNLGVNVTPYFFVNDLPVPGGQSVETLGKLIDFAAAGGEIPEVIPVGDDYHVFGEGQEATSVAIVFVDYASPESAKHARETLPALAEDHIDPGTMIYVVHPWADQFGSASAQAAIAAECAGEQGKYRRMHNTLLDEQDTWSESKEPNSHFVEYAVVMDLDADEFEGCLDSEQPWLRVQGSTVLGSLNNLPSIPFFVFNNGQGWLNAQSADEFQEILDSNLNP